MRHSLLHILPLVLLMACCRPQQENDAVPGTTDLPGAGNEQYAGKFSMINSGDLTLLNVYTPWQNAEETKFSYLLGKDSRLVPDSLSDLPFIKIPVEKTVIMSTTFIGFLDTLGVARTITGVSGGRYIYNQALAQRYRDGMIREVGYDQQMNYELLLDLDPDVVFLFGVQSGIVQTVNKLQDAGIPVVICADYLEPHPLGRAEWIRFFAAFYDQQERAATIFRDVAHRYDSVAHCVADGTVSIKGGTQMEESSQDKAAEKKQQGESSQDKAAEKKRQWGSSQAKTAGNAQQERGTPVPGACRDHQRVADATDRDAPEVMLGLPWKDTWYVAGGRSFAAKLISDAGGAYLFRDHEHAEAKPYDIEAVFSRAIGADVWINPGIATSMDEILEHDQRFGKLDVFRSGAIYNNNKRLGPGGGNDYWESGVVRPDLVLSDLVKIFNDPPADSNALYYYRMLK